MAKYFFKMMELNACNEMMALKRKFDFKQCAEQGIRITNEQKSEIEDRLQGYPFPKNADDVDLSEVINDWFPSGEYDIFLSHSHKDEKLAIAISFYLKKTFDLNCFVDSCVWGYAETLLKELDERYSNSNDYDCRNGTTAHVHLMLNSALMEVMQSSTAFIFLQTGNSLETERKGVKNWTYSSWIYSELNMSRVMSNILYPKKEKKLPNSPHVILESAKLPMGYSNVTTNHLKDITLGDIQVNFIDNPDVENVFNHLYKRESRSSLKPILEVKGM
jgi:hypothetical protein